MILCIYKHVKTEPHDKFSNKVRLFNLENIFISLKIMVYNDRQLNVHTIDFAVTWVKIANGMNMKQMLLSNAKILQL